MTAIKNDSMYQEEPDFFTAPLTALSAELWAEAFSETPDEAEDIIGTLSLDARAVLSLEGERIVFQGALIPVTVGIRFGYYLYALTTAADRRGRGYLRRALDYLRTWAKEDGAAFLLLIPADDALKETYRRMGFSVSLPLAASADAREGYLDLPPTGDEIPFDGDLPRLYRMTARSLPFSAFVIYLSSIPDGSEIFYTEDGFRLRAAKDRRFCLFADKKTLKSAPIASRAVALLLPLDEDFLPDSSLLADPLPR